MNRAIETITSIASSKALMDADLRYCLMSQNKLPLKIDGTPARPNVQEDFVKFEEILKSDMLNVCAGVGISVQASNVCAIDIDKCFKTPFDISSGDDRARVFIQEFSPFTYVEFSFSGTGLRILFRADVIQNYNEKYYIKNSNNEIEYYQPSKSNRYVSITGRNISNKGINYLRQDFVYAFLNKYMLRKVPLVKNEQAIDYKEDKDFEELWSIVKSCCLKDFQFENTILNAPPVKSKTPVKGGSESEKDFYIICYLYEHVTKDKEMIKRLFENTYYFKHKDFAHLKKWNNGYYFDFQYNNAARGII